MTDNSLKFSRGELSEFIKNPMTLRKMENLSLTVDQGNGAVPIGGIILWSGAIADIPTGWSLCNGLEGTPDLRDRFIVGAGSSYPVDSTGGAVSKTTSSNGDHDHGSSSLIASSAGSHNHSSGSLANTTASGSVPQGGGANNAVGSHSHTITGSTGSNGSHVHNISGDTDNNGDHDHSVNVLPPYYSLAYIMRTS